MNCILTLMLALAASLITFSCGLQEVTINEDLPLPGSPEFSSINVNHVLRWSYSTEEKYNDVTFDVEIGEMIFMLDWITEPGCLNITENFCEVVSGVHKYDDGCPELNYSGEYGGRVRACRTTAKSGRQCSDWVESERFLMLPENDKLSPPNFDINGVLSKTQLMIDNQPIVVKHLNKSLNCYYDNKLEYEIKYWGTNDTNQKLQESSASFEMENISLKLLQEPQSHSELCVEMRTVHKVKMLESDWEKKCIVYVRGVDGIGKVTLAVIITSGVAVVFVAVIMCVVKANKMYRYVYKTKFEIPHDLADLMSDSLNNVNVPSLDLMKNADYRDALPNSETNDTASNASVRDQKYMIDSNEIVYLLTPEAFVLPSVTGLSETHETISSDDSLGEPIVTGHTISYDSDCESTPYVRSVQDTNSNIDNAFGDSTSEQENNEMDSDVFPAVNQAHFDWNIEQIRGFSLSDSDLTRSNDKTDDVTDSKPESNRLQKKFQLDFISNSSNYVDHIPQYTKACFERFQLRESMVAKSSDHYTTMSEVLLTKEKTGTRWIRPFDVSTYKKNTDRQNSRTDEDSCYKSYPIPSPESDNTNDKQQEQNTPTNTTVSLNNPTYNSKPVAFDFTDENEKRTYSDHSYDNVRQMKKDNDKSRYLFNTRKSIYQRRRFRNRTLAVRQSRESDMNEVRDSKIHPPKTSHLCLENAPYLKVTKSVRCHSCNSGSSTFSPIRDRIVSADSGYQMGSFSVSDECCSLSPPLSPDDTLYPDVFFSEGSPKMKQPKSNGYRNINSKFEYHRHDEYPSMLSETGSMGSYNSESDLHYIRENLEDISEDCAKVATKMRHTIASTRSEEEIENYYVRV